MSESEIVLSAEIWAFVYFQDSTAFVLYSPKCSRTSLLESGNLNKFTEVQNAILHILTVGFYKQAVRNLELMTKMKPLKSN